jgi:hypothetical protein
LLLLVEVVEVFNAAAEAVLVALELAQHFP